MSSIEKFMDRLGGNNPKPTAARKQPATPAPVPRTAQRQEEPRIVKVNRSLMKDRGLLTPNSVDSRLMRDFRGIKRPVIGNISGKYGAPLENANLVMITSALPGEGKTTTALNLAVSIAMEVDHSVLLIEADISKPQVLTSMGIEGDFKGLTDYLQDGNLRVDDIILDTDIPKLSVIPAGRSCMNGSELLSSKVMGELMNSVSRDCPGRVVILDTGPLQQSPEALSICSLVGQVLVVVDSHETSREVVKEAVQKLDHAKAIGVVLNKTFGNSSSDDIYGAN